MFSLILLWIGALIRLFRSRGNLVLENLVLRQQLAVLRGLGVCVGLRIHNCFDPHLGRRATGNGIAKILSGLNAFEISNLPEQETESRYPGDQDVTMLHGAGSFCGSPADHGLER